MQQSLRALLWLAVSTPEQAADEKESLLVQEAEGREVCAKNNWSVADVLRVPGFSRRYLDLLDFAQGVQQELKQDDGWRLVEHLRKGDFDVFVCRDGDRFGRSQSLFSRIAEDILFVQKKYIYAIRGGGLVSERQGGREWITMQSYRASKEIDDLVFKRDMGMRGRAKRGLRLNALPFPFKAILDERGRDIGLEPDRSVQHIVDDAVTLLLEGQSWVGFELALYQRFGHGRNNHPLSDGFFLRMFYRPAFWGHGAWPLMSKERYYRASIGCWMFDLNEPPPDGVTIYPNTHEPYYTGEKATLIQAELRRRRELRGRMSPSQTSPFSGLLVCASCTYSMGCRRNNHGFQGYFCNTRDKFRRGTRDKDCDNTRAISVKKIRAFLTPRLEEIVRTGNITLVSPASPENDAAHIEAVRREVAQLEADARVMIRKNVPEALSAVHEEELNALAETLSIKRNRLAELERLRDQRSGASHQQQAALKQLQGYRDISEFWEEPGRVINQALRALFGDYRMVVLDGEIIRINVAPPYKKQTRARRKRIG